MASQKRSLYAAQSFHVGKVTDTAAHALPTAAVVDAKDFLVEQPGKAYKRGGWARHSAEIDASYIGCVATIPDPARPSVVAVDGLLNLYDVTSASGPQADLISGDTVYTPRENPALLYGRTLVLCDSLGQGSPKTVAWDPGGSTLVIGDLFGGDMPEGQYSCAYLGGIVIAGSAEFPRRVWFLPDPDLEPDVDVDESWVDVTYDVRGLAAVAGALVVFSERGFERITGSTPYGRPGANMSLEDGYQPGCLDARSIQHVGPEVFYAGVEGVWRTTGYTEPVSLTHGRVQTYWRSLFPAGELRSIIGGLINRDFYLVSVAPGDTLLLHIPTGAWTRMPYGTFMVAQGYDANLSLETYSAGTTEGYVHKLSGILAPTSANANDGDGNPVQPLLTVAHGDALELKSFRDGRVTHKLEAPAAAYATAEWVYDVDGDTVRADLTGAVAGADYTLSVNNGGITDTQTMPHFLEVGLGGMGLAPGDIFDAQVVGGAENDPALPPVLFEYGNAAPVAQTATFEREALTVTGTFPTEEGKTYVMATIDDANGKVCSNTVEGDGTTKTLTVELPERPTAEDAAIPLYWQAYVVELGNYPGGLLGFGVFTDDPNLVVKTAAGVPPGSVVEAARWLPGTRRGTFAPFAGDSQAADTQALLVTVEQEGPSASTEIYGIDVIAVSHAPATKGEND